MFTYYITLNPAKNDFRSSKYILKFTFDLYIENI